MFQTSKIQIKTKSKCFLGPQDVVFLFTSFFGHQGFVSNWTLHTTNTIKIPLNFENRTTDGQVMAKYVSPGGQKMN